MSKKTVKGFTLIELLLTISLLAVVVALTALKLGGFRLLQEEIKLTQLMSDLHGLKTEAILSQKAMTFVVVDEAHYELRRPDSIERISIHPLRFVARHQPGEIVSMRIATTGAPNLGGHLYVQGKKNYKITVQPGMARIRKKVLSDGEV